MSAPSDARSPRPLSDALRDVLKVLAGATVAPHQEELVQRLRAQAERALEVVQSNPPPEIGREMVRREIERQDALALFDRALLETLIEQSPHGIIVSDATGRLMLQNRAAERIWAGSATANDVEGWGRYRAFHPDGRPYAPEDWAMAKCLSRGAVMHAEEVHFQRFDDSHGVLLGSAAPLRDPGGRLLGAVTVFADITPFKAAEQERAAALERERAALADNARLFAAERDARARAEQATRARDDLLAVVSHDLRNPLSNVLLRTGLLRRAAPPGPPGDAVRAHVESIQRAAEQMNRLIRDLLDLASIEAGRLSVEFTWCEPASLVEETIELLAPLAAERGQRLERAVAADAPRVLCDRERVLQVFSNLVGNAIKFTPHGGRITVRVEPAEGGVRFAVEDTGPGIAPEQLPHVFDRYWQARRTARGGAGLGLSIARGIVEAHGGTIHAESQPGQGSTFLFTLPVPGPSLPTPG